nr:bifunctional ornithine acetyltransferase/N-acetylglutamate synthase [Thermoleophilaceae bacterium]
MSGDSFFNSRWVDPPTSVEVIDPRVLPAGFRAAGVAAGIKPSGKPDVALLVSDEPRTVSAARFTTNALIGAPVAVSQAQQLGRLRAIVANSGGANVGDGARGLATAEASRDTAAELLGIDPEQIGLASTGGVALELPRERLLGGIASAAELLAPDARDFSAAILTTDSGPKCVSLEVSLSGGTVRLSAQAKGAGMISPRFATMFCFVETDAEVDAATIELLTGVTVRRSFDRISVDGQLSTSDTVYVLANGASGVRVEPESADELALGQTLDSVMRQLAVLIVRDGEGAERAGRVVVRGGTELVEPVARAIADSPLVKAALNGGDPN